MGVVFWENCDLTLHFQNDGHGNCFPNNRMKKISRAAPVIKDSW